MVGGGQGGYERRMEDFVKIQKINIFGGGGGWVGGWGLGRGRVGGSGWGGQGGCERIIEVFGKIYKKNRRGVRLGVGLVGGQGGCERNVGGRG